MDKKISFIAVAVVLVIAAVFFIIFIYKEIGITSFEECAEAGNPVTESYPRQCTADGKIFTEEIKIKATITKAEAKTIAEDVCIQNKNEETVKAGEYNESTGVWRFGLNLKEKKEGCSPICMVHDATKAAGIDWDCANK
ncbi:MAG: hypothetical protein WC435_00475 [Candidatus Paceibacterota bacterium]